ncbi:MAG: toll/interleukin-1 receptor domain-containing protein [Alphaproteobacteria bacterium]|nr:toll/interleukin-1 receptor domain-containing protein [Alphaproteobacteria bacterium]
MKAFISYSHKDFSYLERLHTHLVPLRREGKIDDWHDRTVLAGGELNPEITAELESCGLFLALVSPDFLASNYCYDREMAAAIARHDAGRARVIPIILEPCDWQSTPLSRFKAIPRDGKPIAEWLNPNVAYLDIIAELRRVLTHETDGQLDAKDRPGSPENVSQQEAKRRYRTKRQFDKIDLSDFLNQAFKTIRDFFNSSISEINGIEGIKARFVDIAPFSFTCTILNQKYAHGAAHITVHARTGGMGMWDIYYSFSENAPSNTANGGYNIQADDYELFLKGDFMNSREVERLSAQQAATIIWEKLLENAGVSYA